MKTKAKFFLAAISMSLFPHLSSAQVHSGAAGQFHTTPTQVAFFGLSAQEKRMRALKQDAIRLIKSPPRTTYQETALGCIAVAVYHEARDQSVLGQKAVASVIVQRSLTPQRWGDTPCDVVRPVQFSFMTSRYRYPAIHETEAWKLAVRVALTVMYEGPMEELRGADHYHATYVDPDWRNAMHQIGRIGDHIFYSDPESLPYRLVKN